MSHRPATTNNKTRSTDVNFYLDSPTGHRENTRAADTSMCLENMSPHNHPIRIILDPHQVLPPKKTYKLGLKKLGRKVRGVNSALPSVSLVPVTRGVTQKVQSVTDSYDMRSYEDVDHQGQRYVSERVERGHTPNSRGGHRRNFTPVKMMNYTFEMDRSLNISGMEIAPSKLELYPNIKTVLQDIKQVDSGPRPSESRGKDGTLLHVASRTNSHMSKRAATPGTYPEYPSTNSRIDEVRRSYENTISREEIRYNIEDHSQRKRVLISSDSRPKAWDSEAENNGGGGFMITNNNKIYLQEKRRSARPSQRRRREEPDGEELKQTYKENFLKLIYKGVGKGTQAQIMNRSFIKNIEDSRTYFTTKIRAIVEGKNQNIANISCMY